MSIDTSGIGAASADANGSSSIRNSQSCSRCAFQAIALCKLQPHSEIILVHSAVILSKPGTALALVKESYFSDLVAIASASSPLHQPVNESFEPSEV